MAFSYTIAAVFTVVLLVGVTEAQQNSCAAQLVACANDLNSTATPSSDCCSSIKQVVETQLPCLCGLLNNPGILRGINMTQALELPPRCNIPADTAACRALSPTGSANLPPATPGSGSGNSGSSRIWWVGIPSLVFLWAFTLLFY